VIAPTIEEWFTLYDERTNVQSHHGFEGGIQIAFGAGVQSLNHKPERLRRG